jgi:hypothetical protein
MADNTAPVMTYYQKTVPYVVGGRMFVGDPLGFVLNNETPWIGVRDDQLRNFKIANKRIITEGLIMSVDEPSTDWETPNTYSDAELDEVLKNYLKLKKALTEITSVATVSRLLERAKAQRRPEKTIDLLEEYLEEIDNEKVELEDVERALNK